MKGRSGSKRRYGAAAIEFALVMPVYLIVLLGLLEFARLGMALQIMSTAAREGCRIAALPNHTAADAQTRVNAVLAGSGIPATTITLSPTDPSTATGGTPITLTMSIPFSQVSWLGTATFMNTTIHASASFTSERP